MHAPVFYSRRRTARVDTPEGVWVYWRYAGRDDTSRVKNLSVGGLFIETRRRTVLGATAQIDFLVQEGQIRAEGIVKHVETGRGVGVKFTSVKEADHPILAALLTRLRAQERAVQQGFGLKALAHREQSV